MTRNVALLRRGIELVLEADARGTLRQEHWITIPPPQVTFETMTLDCHTSGCFAGHLVMDEGYRFLTFLYDKDGDDQFIHQVLVNDAGDELELEETFGDRLTIAEHVRCRLGITHDEADALFHFANTTQDLKFLVDRLCAGEEITRLYDHQGVRQTEGDK